MGATDYDSSFDRLDDIINEAFGMQPVMTPAEAMTFLERQLFEQRKRAGEVDRDCDAEHLARLAAEREVTRLTEAHVKLCQEHADLQKILGVQ